MTEKSKPKSEKKPPRKEKPADQLTDKEVLKKLFPKEVRDVIHGVRRIATTEAEGLNVSAVFDRETIQEARENPIDPTRVRGVPLSLEDSKY